VLVTMVSSLAPLHQPRQECFLCAEIFARGCSLDMGQQATASMIVACHNDEVNECLLFVLHDIVANIGAIWRLQYATQRLTTGDSGETCYCEAFYKYNIGAILIIFVHRNRDRRISMLATASTIVSWDLAHRVTAVVAFLRT